MIIINDNDYSNLYDESNDNTKKLEDWIIKITTVLLTYVIIKIRIIEIIKL